MVDFVSTVYWIHKDIFVTEAYRYFIISIFEL